MDESIKLFSNGGTGTIIREAFEVVKKEYADIAKDFLAKYPDTAAVDALKTEPEKRDFILAFRELIKKHAEIQIYEDYSEDDPELGISEQQYNDFRSKYLDIHDTFLDSTTVTVGGTSTEDNSTEDEIGLEDIDFCLELLHSDIINVAYILELIAELNPFSENYEEQRRHIIDTMIKDAELRSKSQLIDGFIRQNVDEDKEGFVERKKKADGSVDLEERLNQYIRQEKGKAIDRLAEDEQVAYRTAEPFPLGVWLLTKSATRNHSNGSQGEAPRLAKDAQNREPYSRPSAQYYQNIFLGLKDGVWKQMTPAMFIYWPIPVFERIGWK